MKRIGSIACISVEDLSDLALALYTKYQQALKIVERDNHRWKAESLVNIIKINIAKQTVSFLSYEDFDKDSHPCLSWSRCVKLKDKTFKDRYYGDTGREKRPILHRKELLIRNDDSRYKKWRRLTQDEMELGLLGRNDIWTQEKWEQLLEDEGIEIIRYRARRTA